jgi:PhoPQ-activated pathogenicity-related protein
MATLLIALLVAGCATTARHGRPAPSAGLEKTALDRYVAAPDPAYTYEIANTIKGEGYTAYYVDMTSQTWRSAREVNRTQWKHWLVIVRPDKVTSPIGLLYIGGGDNDDGPPERIDQSLVRTALATETVVSMLYQIPNQPLIFADDNGREREEDETIAYTWDKFMRTGDENWPLRLPMTKGAVRAMDTITAVCAAPEAGNATVNRFVVAGGSKRGWTTWTTAAVDKRVIAITPFVIDLLNVIPSFEHHWEAYGFWAPAVGDYQEMGIMEWSGTPEYDALMRLVEPYSYRARYTMPKYIVNATGDQFFVLDSSQFYYDDLPGEKYLRYVPNADHSLRDSNAREGFVAFYESIVKGTPRPKYSWRVKRDGTIIARTKDKPSSVKLWQATNPNARDFRVETIGKVWTSTDLADQGGGVYTAKVPRPEKGWTAYFIELTFPSGGRVPFIFSTEVVVTPRKLPFKYEPTDNPPKGFLQKG